MILTNKNDMYIFFETIKQLEPANVLDLGMFLKRIGSISRKVKGSEVPETIGLDGVDFWQENKFPVWKNIYNHIFDAEQFLNQNIEKKYDLVILLGEEELEKKMDLTLILNQLTKYSKYLLTKKLFKRWSHSENTRVIAVDGDTYYLVHLEE